MDDMVPERDLVFIPVTRAAFAEVIDKAGQSWPAVGPIAEAFKQNVLAVSAMCSVPFFMGRMLVQDRRAHLLTPPPNSDNGLRGRNHGTDAHRARCIRQGVSASELRGSASD